MVSTSFDDPRLTAMGLLIEVYEGVTARLEPVHVRHGLCGNDFDTLIRLARSPQGRLRMTDLAIQTSLSTSGITRVVDRLERHGLVRREPCSVDRRSSYAVLTEEGENRLHLELPELLREIEAAYIKPLGGRLDALTDALRVVRDAVRPGALAGGRADSPPTRPTEPAQRPSPQQDLPPQQELNPQQDLAPQQDPAPQQDLAPQGDSNPPADPLAVAPADDVIEMSTAGVAGRTI